MLCTTSLLMQHKVILVTSQDNWKNPVTSRSPARSRTRVAFSSHKEVRQNGRVRTRCKGWHFVPLFQVRPTGGSALTGRVNVNSA